MKSNKPARNIWILIALLAFSLNLSGSALGMSYYWGRHPQKDRLVFQFEKKIPPFKISRTGYKQISIVLPSDIWSQEAEPGPIDVRTAKMLSSIFVHDSTVEVNLRTRDFGFVYFDMKDAKKLIIDIHRDPLGDKWTPPQNKSGNSTARKTDQKLKSRKGKTEQKEILPAPEKTVLSAAQNSTTANNATQTTTKSPEKKTDTPRNKNRYKINPVNLAPVNSTNQGDPLPLPEPAPYRVRSKIMSIGPEQASDLTAKRSPKAMHFQSSANNSAQNRTEELAEGNEWDQDTAETSNSSLDISNEETPANATGITEDESVQNATFEQTEQAAEDEEEVDSGPPSIEGNSTSRSDFEGFWVTTQAAIQNGNIELGIENIQGMLDHPQLPEDMREELSYELASLLFQVYGQHVNEGNNFQLLSDAYENAIGVNLESYRIPDALLHLGLINMQIGNLPEAKGYFGMLRKKYPKSIYVPNTYYYWGDYYYKQGDYQKSADEYQFVIQEYPENKMARPSAVGLARSLEKLGFNDQSQKIIDYIEKRWPRYYVEDPDFLTVAASVKFTNKNYSAALKDYWTYANIDPQGEKVDMALARIGDIYLLLGHKNAAREIYMRTASEFPDKEGGLISKMRLAEEGIYDTPSIKDMFTVFDRPYNMRPVQIYSDIIKNYPQSPLAPVALLKMAMWQLWEKEYLTAIKNIQKFFNKHPTSDLLPNAEEVGVQAFDRWLDRELTVKDYSEIVKVWNEYPFLAKQKNMSPKTRLAVATSLWKTGRAKDALLLAGPFINGEQPFGQQSEMALDLMLGILVKAQSWQDITELAEKVKTWNISRAGRRQLDYAVALAEQNTGRTENAFKLWRELAADIELPAAQRAYALYFLARYSLQKKDLEEVYVFSQQALSLLLETGKDLDKIKDCLDLLIRTTQRSGRLQEALGWALEYERYVDINNPDWPAFTYRLANLYKANKDTKKWTETLKKIQQQAPHSIYSKMSGSDLREADLKRNINRFQSD